MDDIQYIHLNKLSLSPYNVRQHHSDEDIAQAADAILARGILQNLGAYPAKKKGRFEVHYGGCRLKALQLLAERGDIPADHPVPCKLRDNTDDAFEDSLAENVIRKPMHPIDAAEAFAALVGKGRPIPEIAKRFGQTERHIRARLRLACLIDPVKEACRRGEISLDMACAFAVTEDQDRQNRVWVHFHPHATPHQIRNQILQDSITSNNPLALYVGRDAYLAAGGEIEDTLFTEDAIFRDPLLLEQLAQEKMAAEAERLHLDLGVAEVRPVALPYLSHAETEGLYPIDPVEIDLSDEQQARIEEIDAELNALTENDTVFEFDDAQQARLDALTEEREAIETSAWGYTGEQRQTAIVFLLLGKDGKLSLSDGYYSPIATSDFDESQSSRQRQTSSTPKPVSEKPKISQRLIDELAEQRSQVLGAALARNPEIAGDILIFAIVCRLVGDLPLGSDLGIGITINHGERAIHGFRMEGTVADQALSEAKAALNLAWLQQPTVNDGFLAFRTLSREDKGALLAYAMARSLSASAHVKGHRGSAFHDLIGQLLDIDPSRYWRPTAENYWSRISRNECLAALDGLGDPALRQSHAGLKKPQLAAALEKLFAGERIVGEEANAHALAWIPEALRFDPAPLTSPHFRRYAPWEDDEQLDEDSSGDADENESPRQRMMRSPVRRAPKPLPDCR